MILKAVAAVVIPIAVVVAVVPLLPQWFLLAVAVTGSLALLAMTGSL